MGNLRKRMLEEEYQRALQQLNVKQSVHAEIRQLFPELKDRPIDDITKSLEGTFTYQQMQIRHNVNAIVGMTILPLATRTLAFINRLLQRFSRPSETDARKSTLDSES